MIANFDCDLCSYLDRNFSLFHDRRISLDRNHARWRHYRSGPDIELSAVKIALDDVAFDEAFGQRAGAMRAVIVRDEEFAVEVEDSKRQVVPLDLQDGSRLHVGDTA